MSASCDTTSFARRRRAASSARCLGPPRSSDPAVLHDLEWAEDPKLHPASDPPFFPAPTPSERAARRTVQPTVAGLQPIRNPRAAASLHRPPRGRSPNGGGAMLHSTLKRLAPARRSCVTALVVDGRSGRGGRDRPPRRPRDARPGRRRADERLGGRRTRRPPGRSRDSWPGASPQRSETSSCGRTIAPTGDFRTTRPSRSRQPARGSTGSTRGSAPRRRSGSSCSSRAPPSCGYGDGGHPA